MPSGKTEETRISDICKPTTTKTDGKRAGDLLQILPNEALGYFYKMTIRALKCMFEARRLELIIKRGLIKV